ncbi:hypothetical protein ACFLYS_00130 [Chloroflexota bacterium]
MPNNWNNLYTELSDFIAEHPEIEIEENKVRILASVRPEFYQFFNAVRTAFVEERLPDLLNEATVLNQNYLKVEQETIRLLGLDDLSMEISLHRFVSDPINELRRGLFDPLFDLLKGKIGIETLEQRSSRNIKTSFKPLYRLGYEKWVSISLLQQLKADKLFQITPDEFASDEERAVMRATSPEKEAPDPEESNRLSFKYEEEATFTVPDFIVHSARINRYVALRAQMGKAFATASNFSKKMEWHSLDSKTALEPGITLIYMADDPREISLVADAKKICRPDLIIECREQKDWYEREGLGRIMAVHNNLKPKLGTYIVCKESAPQQVYKELAPQQICEESSQVETPNSNKATESDKNDIHILVVGFDQSKLEPIISALDPVKN